MLSSTFPGGASVTPGVGFGLGVCVGLGVAVGVMPTAGLAVGKRTGMGALRQDTLKLRVHRLA